MRAGNSFSSSPSPAGDANLDTRVNALDFNALATHYGVAGTTWVAGDCNYDGIINTLDFTALAANFGGELSSSSAFTQVAPEPWMVCTLASPLLIKRRRSHRVGLARWR